VEQPRPSCIALIAALGVRLLPAALRLLSADQPGRRVRLVLVGPGGGDWTVPLGAGTPPAPPDATVTMEAVEFCHLLGDRREPSSVPHTVQGIPPSLPHCWGRRPPLAATDRHLDAQPVASVASLPTPSC
jgi:hypothetical protein